jgi:hypothetical protein
MGYVRGWVGTYILKSKHAEPVATSFAQVVAAFLPPKIMQSDNGKEFKRALLTLLRKFEIQIINGAPRSPQTQGLVEQANRFGRILEELYSHRYKVLTCYGNIKRLIPTKELGVIAVALWLDINIPETTKEVTLGLAAREASTTTRVGISCQCKEPCNTKRCMCSKETK